MKKYNRLAWVLLSLGCLVLFVEIIYFSHLTSLVWNPIKFDSDSVQITSSIGSMIGGTVGVLFSLASVMFFIIALRSQQEESKIIRAQTELQALEISIFNLFVIQNDIRKSISENPRLIKSQDNSVNQPPQVSSLRNTDISFQNLFKSLNDDCFFFCLKETMEHTLRI